MTSGYLLHFVLPFALAVIISIVLIPLWISVCTRWKLFDEPDARKHHQRVTPSMGGIAIFAALFISFLVFAEIYEHNKLRYLFGGALILFFTGFFDDLTDIPPTNKLLLQCISAIIIFYGGFNLSSFGGLLWLEQIPIVLQLPITVFMVLLFTNAYNFIDGVDGLAGSLGVIITSCFGALFIHYGKLDFAVLSFCVTGALLGFLFYNFAPAKIFMGDTGSLVIGFIISVMAIELHNTGISNPGIAIKPVLIIAILFIPLYDITRVFLIRMVNGNSPFLADRNHMHHLMLGYGFGHRSVALLMAALGLSLVLIPQIFNWFPTNATLFALPFVTYMFLHPKILGTLASFHHRFFGNHIENNSDSRVH